MFGGTPTGANLTNYMHTRTVTFPLPTLRLNSRARLEFTPTRFTLLVNLVGCAFYLEDALLHSEGSGKHVFATVVTHDVASVFVHLRSTTWLLWLLASQNTLLKKYLR